MKPGTLVKLKKEYLDYQASTRMIEAEDILLFVKWDITSRRDNKKGVFLFRETLIYADTYIFEAL